jgi:short subunit dehydrogenase-like uncharacterized protein
MLLAMALLSRQRGPIALYGATGYTGKLTAAELRDAKADFVLCGRNRGKLEALASELGGDVEVRPAALDDERALASAFEDCAAVIDCAGPFTLHGEPVLRAAVQTSTHYLDTTGEQPYMRTAIERYGPSAGRAGVAVIPAMGFDYVPGDMITSLTAEGMGEVDEVMLAYAAQGFRATRGTTLSTLEMLKGGDVEWRKLQWLPADQSVGRGHFDFPEPIGRQRMIRYPAGEQITVPRHIPTRRVRTMVTASTIAPAAVGPLLPLFTRPTGIAMKTPLKNALSAMISRLPEGPSPEDRTAARFTIVCDVTRGRTRRRGVIRGSDVYGLTAASVAQGAIIAARGGIPATGGLAPSQAFDPRRFLKELARFDVAWDVSPEDREPAMAAA